ncbi:nonsense mediated decay protein 3-like protein [Thalassiosira pseudonana CCMP1335]|uniref:60S ribosomal export protein NMD3 n=1 Tax=Thalassiosira pseudonana TaxID=35128 RepID=B5YNP3_THAPS|nr:nonsense mediated decay protein 3-like protein [Thalassiosira pseudonana CCMP1335]ACI65023.1 nonsense mediated decay protein 3-like protein [Thalassiosira pseudonana CCMP1335]
MEISTQPILAPTNDPSTSSSHGTAATILCCICATPIHPNPSNTCPSCLASTADVTRGISTEATLHQCRGCSRWHHDAGKWIGCELESRELMGLCLGNVSGLKKRKGEGVEGRVRLVDAAWVWTEPHSMRLKIRLTIQREVVTGTILQQSFIVTFIVRNQQCVECQAAFRQGSWKSLVQVRQRVGHKRTFLYLEQLILKHGAHRGCLSIETFKDGMDFYFPDKGKANRFISFLEDVVPMKVKSSKKLIGTDDKSNVSNYKYTNLVEICSLCKDDLLFLPKKLARSIGNINRLVLVKNVSNVINVIDPLTGQTGNIESDAYWRDPFRPVITAARTRLTRYVILGKDPVFLERNMSKLASITAARESDLGANDSQMEEHSHLGYLMKSGDVCMGYDLTEAQLVDDEAEELRTSGKLPDFVFVRKLYGGVATGESDAAKKRMFKLKRLDVKDGEEDKPRKKKKDAEMENVDEEDFMQELEADKEMRTRVNIYKSDVVAKRDDGDSGEEDDEEDEDDQKITLDELLDNLVLDSKPDAADDVMGEEAGEEQQQQLQFTGVEGERAALDNIAYVGRDEAINVNAKDTAVPVAGNVWGKDFLDPDL